MLCTAWYDARNTITSSAYSEITSNSLAKTKGFKTLISLSSAKTVYSVFWHNSFSFCKSYLLCKVVIQFSNDATRQYLLVWVTSTKCSILVAFIVANLKILHCSTVFKWEPKTTEAHCKFPIDDGCLWMCLQVQPNSGSLSQSSLDHSCSLHALRAFSTPKEIAMRPGPCCERGWK